MKSEKKTEERRWDRGSLVLTRCETNTTVYFSTQDSKQRSVRWKLWNNRLSAGGMELFDSEIGELVELLQVARSELETRLNEGEGK